MAFSQTRQMNPLIYLYSFLQFAKRTIKELFFNRQTRKGEVLSGDKGVNIFQGNAMCREASTELRGPKSKLLSAGEPMRSLPAPAANPREVQELEAPVSHKAGSRPLIKNKGKVGHSSTHTLHPPSRRLEG